MAEHPLGASAAGAGKPGEGAASAVPETAQDLRELFAAKVLAEVASADAAAPGSDAVLCRGNPLARVMVLKGLPGPAEASGDPAVSGADGDAAVKALVALGYATDDAFFALTRPEPGIDPDRRVARVRALVEAVDPAVVVALDGEAAMDLSQAYGETVAPSAPRRVAGRRLIAVDGLEASLADRSRKRAVWRQFQAASPEGPIY